MSVNNVQSNFSNGMSYSANLVSTTIPTQSLVPIHAITAATTLTPTQSGSTFTVSQVAAYDVTLPDLQNGLNYKFICVGAAAHTVGIKAASGTPIVGWAMYGPHAGVVSVQGAGTLRVNFVASKAGNGDMIQLHCDGTNWFAQGFSGSNTTASITFA